MQLRLSAKYIPDRFLPDKAIDLVDEAAAMVKMAIDSQPEEIDQLERKIRQFEIEKVALSKETENELSKKRLAELEKELAAISKKSIRHCSINGKQKKRLLKKLISLKNKLNRHSNNLHKLNVKAILQKLLK